MAMYLGAMTATQRTKTSQKGRADCHLLLADGKTKKLCDSVFLWRGSADSK
jgi:hypothetical protein